ncbi:MAG: alkene reductase [Bryobacteraceae bacterium]|nr:alkene reductase [Bryobacteraceae bacterium]
MSQAEVLHTPLALGAITLRNRLVMAPLTRMRASMPGNVPTEMNARYYRQRATAGLIISEATPISPTAHGYYATPGMHSPDQVEGWKLITRAVHEGGAPMFLQLWHVGRVSHSDLQPGGALPVAPSAIAAAGNTITATGPQPMPVPRALETAELPAIVEDYRLAASRAMDAGFDGVEIHAANGYLLEQFLSEHANHRTDGYGGSIENRTRLLLEVTEAVTSVWGPGRVGVRLSPSNTYQDIHHADRWEVFSYAFRQLDRFPLAYVHLVEPRVAGNNDIEPVFDLASSRFRPLLTGSQRLISAGGHNRESAARTIGEGHADLVAFGRLFLANPDLPERFRLNAPLNRYDRATFYGGTEQGYLDYPALDSQSHAAGGA